MERIQFRGIDGWNRPVFKSLDKPRTFYGNTHTLFSYDATESDVLEKITAESLTYFGDRFDCEPTGTPPMSTLTIVKE